MLASVYTDLTSGYESIVFDSPSVVGGSHLVGATYDPRSTASPVPFHSGCNHCRISVTSPLPIRVKRLVKMLLTRRRSGYIPQYDAPVYQFVVPTNITLATAKYWKTPKNTCVVTTLPDGRVLSATRDEDGDLSFGGNVLITDAKILGSCVRFLLSTRRAKPHEVVALLSALTQTKRATHWHANPCRTIPWGELLRAHEEAQ